MPTLQDLNQAIGGRLMRDGACDPAAPLGAVVTDSRRVEEGNVFWGLRGPNHNGSHYAAEAFERGAAGAVVDRLVDVPEGRWGLQVENTYGALLDWAGWNRRRFTGTVIAVTGSVGKTTTRQMIHTVLQSRLPGTASPRNYNNHVGVPLSMLTIQPEHHYAVLEIGASHPGEIAAMAELSRPKVGVITQIGDAHLGGFGSRQHIAEAKAELLAALPREGRAILGDDPRLHSVASRCKADITWVGAGSGCDVRAVDVTSEHGRLGFRVVFGEAGEPSLSVTDPSHVRFSIPVWGRHHLTAALAAVAAGRMMGLDLEVIAAALEKFQPVPMRCEVRQVRGATIINDAYNSNPTAMQAALELLREFDTTGRRIVVCGDMGELGTESVALHWHLGKQIVQAGGADLVVACGQFARHVTSGARAAGILRTRAIPCDTVEDALPYLGQAILPGDVVLVKGSRMMGMERVVEALEQYPKRRSA